MVEISSAKVALSIIETLRNYEYQERARMEREREAAWENVVENLGRERDNALKALEREKKAWDLGSGLDGFQ